MGRKEGGRKRGSEGRKGRRKEGERRKREKITGRGEERKEGRREAALTWSERRWILASYCSQQPELT